MPWVNASMTLLMLFAVLFSGISGNLLLDHHMSRLSVPSKRDTNENTNNVKNCIRRSTINGQDAEALQHDEATRRFYSIAAALGTDADADNSYDLERSKLLTKLYGQYDCIDAGSLPAAAQNLDLFGTVLTRTPSETKRNAYVRAGRDSDSNTDELNDIFAWNSDAVDSERSKNQPGHSESENVSPLSSILPAIYSTYSADLYEDLLEDEGNPEVKRAGTAPVIGCECKIKNDLLDLGQQHFPRYLLNAVCQTENDFGNDYEQQKCWRGSYCKPLEYKVKVLTFRLDHGQKDPTLAWLPDDLRHMWKFKTVTVAAGCFCSY